MPLRWSVATRGDMQVSAFLAKAAREVLPALAPAKLQTRGCGTVSDELELVLVDEGSQRMNVGD